VEHQEFEDFKNQIIEKLNTDIYTLSQRLEALEWQIQRYMNTPGPPGVKGDRGAVGQKGDKGIKGEKGERGDLGYIKLRGEPGNTDYYSPGVPGPTGPLAPAQHKPTGTIYTYFKSGMEQNDKPNNLPLLWSTSNSSMGDSQSFTDMKNKLFANFGSLQPVKDLSNQHFSTFQSKSSWSSSNSSASYSSSSSASESAHDYSNGQMSPIKIQPNMGTQGLTHDLDTNEIPEIQGTNFFSNKTSQSHSSTMSSSSSSSSASLVSH